jgi:hypothetical protein
VTLEDPVAEATRLLEAAEGAEIPIRAVGGIAVWLRSPSLQTAEPPRVFHDIDLAAPKRASKPTASFLEDQGYEPHRRFNTLAGTRLMFTDRRWDRRLDVFLDLMEMCHRLTFGDRLTAEPKTIPLADLLLTKLQVIELTDRDVVDLAALLADHRLRVDGGSGDDIEVSRVLEVCARDWGWWRTVTGNLRYLEDAWSGDAAGAGPDRAVARERASELRGLLERSPKSVRWKARAVVGERVPWYQEPEEVR